MSDRGQANFDTPARQRERRVGCEGTPGQGPFMAIVIELEADQVLDANFQTYGCPVAIACGEYVCNWVPGKTLEMAGTISEEDVIKSIGHPPLGREHCPGLAVKALRKALHGELAGSPSSG
jgi:nitrogen fixation NifU-like protein